MNCAHKVPAERFEIYLKTSPTLIGVFREYSVTNGSAVQDIIDEIIGSRNEVENAIEYLNEEFGIETVEIPARVGNEAQVQWEEIFGTWLAEKRLWPGKKPERIEILARNDVNAFSAAVQLRHESIAAGGNYGHKIWVLTLDRMFWRVPKRLSLTDDIFRVAMSVHYLVNFVATLANVAGAGSSIDLPVAILMSEGGFIPAELREALTKEWLRPGQKRYQVDRHIRQLLSDLKSSVPEAQSILNQDVNILDEEV
jgi:hypothetical protein